MVPACKNVAPYSPTPLHVGIMINAPLCNSLYLFLPFLCHPYLQVTIFVEKIHYVLFLHLLWSMSEDARYS